MSLRSILLLLSFFSFVACSSNEKEKPYLIGRDKSWYALNLMGKEKNLQAFSDDVLYAIANEMGFHVDLDPSLGHTLQDGLQTGPYDALVSAIQPSSREQEIYNDSDPFFLLGPVLIVQENSTATSLNDMKDKVVGFRAGTPLIFTTEKAPFIIFTPYDNILFALRNLDQGHIDGVIMDAVPAIEYTNSFYKGDLKVVTGPLTNDGLRLITLRNRRGNHLVELFDEGLKKIKADGTYEQLLKKWNLLH